MKNFLVKTLKQAALAGIVGASTLFGSGCAAMLDSRCKDKTIYVTSSEDNRGGVDVQLISVGFGSNVIQKQTTPCSMVLYRNGDNISGARTPYQPAIGNYVLCASKKNILPEEAKKNPYNYVDLKKIDYKVSPLVGVSFLFFPVGPIIESISGGGKYYEEDNVHFDFNVPPSERQNKFNVNFKTNQELKRNN